MRPPLIVTVIPFMKTDLFTSVLIRDSAYGHIDMDCIEGYIRHIEAFYLASGLKMLQWPLDTFSNVTIMAHNIDWVKWRSGYRVLALEITVLLNG